MDGFSNYIREERDKIQSDKTMAFSSILGLWNKWNIWGFVILSLLLQVFLILFAPLRKKTANDRIVFLLWLAYLMADWVAAFTIGLISHNQGNSFIRAAEVDKALQAFWASFLLLHLGGPDTITAFSLEDSSLWRRHLLSLIFQVGAAIYVFVQIFPDDKSLAIPTMLVLFAAVIQNAERVRALNLSSLPRLRRWKLSQHNPINVNYYEAQEQKKKIYFELVGELNLPGNGCSDEEYAKLVESNVVKHAYFFFHIFKVFLGDLMFTYMERFMSRQYFHKISASDALRVISVELHFIYEVLHTKTLAIRSKWSYIFRFIAFTNVVMAFALFKRLKKHQLPNLDVEITYILLSGGITLDVITLFMLVFSDWTVAGIKYYKTGSTRLDSILHSMVSATDDLRKPRFATCELEANVDVSYSTLDTPLIYRRWSESIFACNIFSESLKESPRKIFKHDHCAFSNICSFPFHIVEKIISCFQNFFGRYEEIPRIENTKYVAKNPFIKELWTFIFKEVRRKSEQADDTAKVKKIFEARGDVFLESRSGGINCDNFLSFVTNANYDDSIILWHLATEICYIREREFMNPLARNDEREFSKILSDYMLYLLLNQPDVVSTVAGISQMTIADMLHLIRVHINYENVRLSEVSLESLHETISHISRLREGINLAQEMERLGEMKWKVASGVWVEMLSYAAIHIKGDIHVQVLSKGGELLAFVWLLMAHFGCFYKPEWGIHYEFYDNIQNHQYLVPR